LIPVQAELGSSTPSSRASADHAPPMMAAAMFSFAGQRCTRSTRPGADTAWTLIDRLAAAVKPLRTGEPNAATQVGPVLDKQRQRALVAMAARRR
jgi:acyl-CoA reductase-like NAD-dependent aldehyde dehydrogenase